MKLQKSVIQRFGFVVVTSFALATLTSCRGAGGLVDDFGRGMSRSGDELGQTGGSSSDDFKRVVSEVGTVDSVTAPQINSGSQSPKVVKVVQKSDNSVDAVVENVAGQAIEVAVDCATSLITPSEAIPSSQQDDFVQAVCSQVAGNAKPEGAVVRVVDAGEGYANLRSSPSTEVSSIAQIPNGTSVRLIEKTQNSSGQLWYKVEANGQVGWMYSGLLD